MSNQVQFNYLPFVAVILLTVTILGCASLGKKECLSGDWETFGQTDGARGRLATSRVSAHSKACAKHGVQFEETKYMLGHAEGVKTYCTVINGLDVGSKYVINAPNRRGYNSVCPTDLQYNFLRGYVSGLRQGLNTLNLEINEGKEQINSRTTMAAILRAENPTRADELINEIELIKRSIIVRESKVTVAEKEMDKWLEVAPEL